jgi:hypothetical protein
VETRIETEEDNAKRRNEIRRVLAPGYEEIFVAGAKCRALEKEN